MGAVYLGWQNANMHYIRRPRFILRKCYYITILVLRGWKKTYIWISTNFLLHNYLLLLLLLLLLWLLVKRKVLGMFEYYRQKCVWSVYSINSGNSFYTPEMVVWRVSVRVYFSIVLCFLNHHAYPPICDIHFMCILVHARIHDGIFSRYSRRWRPHWLLI